MLARVCVRLNVIVNSIFQCKCVCTYVHVCVCACNCHACICTAVCCCFCVCYYNNYLKNTPISASASTAPAELFKCFCVRGLQVKTNTHTHIHFDRYSEGYTRTGGLVIQSQKHTHNSSLLGCSTGAVRESTCMCVCVRGKGMRERRAYVPCVPESA